MHSPFVFDLSVALLEDDRWYYAFRDVELVRRKMLDSDVGVEVLDLGSGGAGASGVQKRRVRQIARQSGSSVGQGQMLFRLANHLHPKNMLELGTSLGIGAMYLASAVREARFLSLEGSPEIAHIARLNLELLGLSAHTEVREGAFEQTLKTALQDIQSLDFVFFDGNHRPEPTLQYFEQCLAFAHAKAVFVFDDMHWSKGMTEAWEAIQKHPKVTLTLDFFELSLVFIDPDFKAKQHLNILPARWKPWRFL